jgi:transcriptional regulator
MYRQAAFREDRTEIQQEAHRANPWSVDDAPPAFIDTMMKGIVGVEIPVDQIEGKWKASQNRPAADQARVAAGLREDDPFSAMAAIVEAFGAKG